jgi:hypothetical protein
MKRRGVHCEGACDFNETPLLIRGNVVSCDLADGRTVDFPESWGLVHDITGQCLDKCEIFICPYTARNPIRHRLPSEVHEAAVEYFGEGEMLLEGTVELPTGPWERVGVITRVYYSRYGELSSPYQHPFKKGAVLHKQKRAHAGRQKAYRISLPSDCVITAHGFVDP